MSDIVSQKDFLHRLRQVADQTRQMIDAYDIDFDASAKSRKMRAKQLLNTPITADLIEFFGRTYFPHYIRLDKHGNAVPLSVFQQQLLTTFAHILNGDESHTQCIVAPRGEAKSTWAFIFIMFCIVRACKRYIPYIMDTAEQASESIESMKTELQHNNRLRLDFGFCVGKSHTWQAGVFVSTNNIKVQAFGSSQKTRGRKYGAYRPDLVILDDIENDENVQSPTQRDKLQNWLNSSVLGLSEAGEKMDVCYIGTLLHPDSVLARTMQNPAWHTTICKSIIQYPTRTDMWDTWEEIYRNDGKPHADTYYNDNADKMNDGAVVSWPSKRSLYYLMNLKMTIGPGAFLSEQQGEHQPRDAVFTDFTYWQQPRQWTFYGVCDPSLGLRGKGRDPSAILVGGVVKGTTDFILDIIEAKIRKRTPSKIIDDIIALQKQYTCVKWGIETVQFQEFLRQQLMQTAHAQGVPINAVGIKQTTDKHMRIESLESPIRDGLIRFNTAHDTLITQLRQFPEAPHDDGPDALEMLYNIAVRKQGARFGIIAGNRTYNTGQVF